MNLAPIVIFTYNRPEHTTKVLDALASNPDASRSNLYIYCDGPKPNTKDEDLKNIKLVRNIVNQETRFKNVDVTIQKKNKGLAKSVVDGVSEIVSKYGRVIVLEDDIVTSPGFLEYMNESLELYRDNNEVMHISGYMYPHEESLPETFFYNVSLCWGWATWSRAWDSFNDNALELWSNLIKTDQFRKFDKFGSDHLSRQLAYNILGKLNTWFIKWHASVTLQNGYTLFPCKSLVNNIGFDSTGQHKDHLNIFEHKELSNKVKVKKINLDENTNAINLVKKLYSTLRNESKDKNLYNSFKKKIIKTSLSVFPELNIIKSSKNQKILKQTYIGHSCQIYKPARMFRVIIGKYSYVSENSIINNTVIGNYCSIGPNLISGWGIHPTNGVSTHPMFYSTAKQNGHTLCQKNKIHEFEPVIIGNDVFIGMNVSILDGVSIGNGAIIGAGAVVSKDIPPFAIAVGNPIKIIKYRFEKDTINRLQQTKWWELDKDDNLIVEKHFFDIEVYLNSLNK